MCTVSEVAAHFIAVGAVAYLPIYNVSRVSGSSGWEAEIKCTNVHAQPVRLSKQMIERAGEQQAGRVCDVTLSPRRNLSHFSGFFFFFFSFK